MAERQTQHRIQLENKVIESDIRRSYAGLAVGGFLALLCTVGGCWLVYLGHDAAGGTIATAAVAGLAGVFVYGTASRRKEREEKARIMTRK